MAAKRLAFFKRFLAWLGAKLPIGAIYQCEAAVNHLKLGRWLADQGYRFPRIYPSRREVFRDMAERIRDRRVLYLEFGVFQGASMRIWSEELKNPESHLHGFDSFEGLPDDYISIQPKGHFTTAGAIPQIDDPRVKFFKGWFEETLPTYQTPEHEVLVLNLDADLYSSTIYVLRHFQPWIRRGTLIYLDDMAVPDHEGRAFAEFSRETGLRFAPLSADRALCCQAYECLGGREE